MLDFIKPIHKRMIKAVFARLRHPTKKMISKYKLVSLSGEEDVFCGYYDIRVISSNNLFLTRREGNHLNIIQHDLNTQEEKKLGVTNSWNWQQGCRLRLSGDLKSIFFNDYRYNCLKTVRKDLYSGEETEYDFPFYDIDKNDKFAASIDFQRLGILRPGYGYVVDGTYQLDHNDCGRICIYNIREKRCEKNYDIKKILKIEDNASDVYYLNHLSFSPNADKLMFFLVKKPLKGFHMAHMYIIDLLEDNIHALEVELCVSHYAWKDNNTLIVTAYDDKRNCAYYLYDVETKKRSEINVDILKEDGHPSYINNNTIITDTYPDKYGYEHIYKVNIEDGKYEELCSIYHTYKVSGEQRCDLHPRIAMPESLLCFDANTNGKRSIVLLEGAKYDS